MEENRKPQSGGKHAGKESIPWDDVPMVETEEGSVVMNGREVDILGRKVGDGVSEMKVFAGSTGQTGCSFRRGGGPTCLSLECLDGDFFLMPYENEDGDVNRIDIACCGDSARNTLIRCLSFALDVLKHPHGK